MTDAPHDTPPTSYAALLKEAMEALRPFLNLVAKDEEGKPEDGLEGLPDGHAFDCVWRMEEGHGDRSPFVTAGQFRRARAVADKIREALK